MIQKIKSSPFYETLSHSFNYITSGLAQEGLKLISIPVLTILLSTEDYGIINIFIAWVSMLSIVSVLNLHGAVSRYYYEFKNDFNEFLGYSILLATVPYVISFLVVFIYVDRVAELLDIPKNLVYFMMPMILFQVIDSLFAQLFQAKKESKRIRKYAISKVYLTFGLTVGLILMKDENLYMGRIEALIIVSSIFAIIKFKDLWQYIKFNVNHRHLKYIAIFALPNIPYLLSGYILSQFDRIMINSELGASDAGLYSFAYNIGMLQLMVSNALHKAWTPKYYAAMKDNNVGVIKKDSVFFSKLIAVGACGLMMFGMEIGRILGAKSYHSGLFLIPWIVAGLYFIGLSPFFKNYILHAKKTWITAAITLSAGAVNVILNYYFIPLYGSLAAAFTTLASYFLLFVTEYVVATYVLKLNKISITYFLQPIGVVALCAILYHNWVQDFDLSISNIGIKLFLLIGLVFIIFWKESLQYIKIRTKS